MFRAALTRLALPLALVAAPLAAEAAGYTYKIDRDGPNVDIVGTITMDNLANSYGSLTTFMISGDVLAIDLVVSTPNGSHVFDQIGFIEGGVNILYTLTATELTIQSFANFPHGGRWIGPGAQSGPTAPAYLLADGTLGIDGDPAVDGNVSALVFERVADVPLPAGLALLPAGLALLAARRRGA